MAVTLRNGRLKVEYHKYHSSESDFYVIIKTETDEFLFSIIIFLLLITSFLGDFRFTSSDTHLAGDFLPSLENTHDIPAAKHLLIQNGYSSFNEVFPWGL